jgi:hypothetical protein
MIISHRHKFIFIHLGRTGGRSLTVELEKNCGPDDVVTPAGDISGRNHVGWSRHTTALRIRDRLGHQILDDYFVFTVDRNPWDKMLSNYWAYKGYLHGAGGKTEQVSWVERVWRKVSGYPWSFDCWMKYRIYRSKIPGFRPPFSKAYSKYADENGKLMVDAIFRYEHLSNQIGMLAERLGFPLVLDAREGKNTRCDRRPYTEHYKSWSRAFMDRYYAEEIALMNYRFGEPVPSNVVGLTMLSISCILMDVMDAVCCLLI